MHLLVKRNTNSRGSMKDEGSSAKLTLSPEGIGIGILARGGEERREVRAAAASFNSIQLLRI